ncbi:MAG: hypothetical protein M9944_16825 [Rhizobiaceae bacterium]|nr:hypothetical protein [Rhizobiaceae bacterium]
MSKHERITTGRSDTLDYLQSMLLQMRTLADSEGYDMVAYFIGMAYTETVDISRGTRPSSTGRNSIDRKN